MASNEDPVEEDQVGGIAGSTIGDHPTHADSLGFKPYVEAIASFLLADATRPPITISIEGEWGSGKSSFLLQLEDAIVGERPFDGFINALPGWLGGASATGSIGAAWKKLRGPRPPLTVRFNAWRHDKQDSVWAAFALAFVQSLRKEIGLRRALWGDIKLFLKRLTGFRGWLQLALLAVSALVFLVGLVAFCIYIARLAPDDLHTLFIHILQPTHETSGMLFALTSIASHGVWAAIAAVGFAGIYKFHSHFKMPISLSLEKYLARPDYQGHVAFIESFHLDLKRLIEAYAGKKRVFVFVDDLDRCDVPRAAELMQAINLMIGDAGNLIFILGMDREKVAAGVALKYKELFPFLRESAEWKPDVDKGDFTPLYFGYAYLEKFIQISFSLPIARYDTTLNDFLREHPAVAPSQWRTRIWQHWKMRRTAATKRDAFTGFTESPEPTTASTAYLPALPEKIEYQRLEIKEDSDRIRNIVRMVSGLFENNPRRIKQFTNTFRLALYIASDQGIFDYSATASSFRVTPEQIGKFVALLLRFPDLRYKLEEDPGLLSSLQKLSCDKVYDNKSPAREIYWLRVRGTIELFAYKLGYSEKDETVARYSLEHLDVSRLFTILPRAPRPPELAGGHSEGIWLDSMGEFSEPDREILNQLLDVANRYEQLGQPTDEESFRTLDLLFRDAVARARQLTPAGHRRAVIEPQTSQMAGRRLMCIAIARAQYEPTDTDWLLQMLDSFLSPFEHYWCIQTLSRYAGRISREQKTQIVEILDRHWTEIERDTLRYEPAKELLNSLPGADDSPPVSKASSQAPPPEAQRPTPTGITFVAGEMMEDAVEAPTADDATQNESVSSSSSSSGGRRRSQPKKIATKK
jgi:KAP family P-loop domain